MNEERNATSATCNRQTNREAAYAQIQIGSSTHMKNHLHLGLLGSAMPRRLLLTLACIVTLAAGLNWAAATDQIPYKDAAQAHITDISGNDQTFAGEGIGTHVGNFRMQIQVNAGNTIPGPVPGTFLVPLVGTITVTAANGDMVFSTFVGFEVLDFSLGLPWHFEGTRQITGGTGRFAGATGSLTSSGLDYGDGNISVTSEGTISSVGSNKN